MTIEQLHAQHEKLFGRMLAVGWLDNFAFTDGRSWTMSWTVHGARRAILLKAIIKTHGLDQDDRAPISFLTIAQGGMLIDMPVIMDKDALKFFRQCCTDIDFASETDADDLLAFVHIILMWAPSLDTPVRFI